MKQAATEANVLALLAKYKAGNGPSYDGGGYHCNVRSMWLWFPYREVQAVMKSLSEQGLLEYSGRGKHRAVRLTAAGMQKAGAK